MPSPRSSLQATSLRPWLKRCGYPDENVVQDLEVGGSQKAAIAAFSQRPFDTRSACIMALDVVTSPKQEAAACRHTGAPVALLCWKNELLWWRQGEDESQEFRRVPASQLEGFFREHREDLAPKTIYRAKTLGRFESSFQRDFVDLGLMPMVEKEAGEVIERLLLDQVDSLRLALGWPKDLSLDQGQWLVKSVFWLLGAKMLQDKRVDGFIRLDFGDVEQVFERVARHYGQSAESIITSQKKLKALQKASDVIVKRADLRLASTEALAYVYENTLITREVRKGLGTHSTPAYLIDYIVGRLTPWISEMKPEDRRVFEPTCGHGGFLVAAVRLLTSLLPSDDADPANRRAYLRKRIQGCDIDEFALEIARLSLTLTDIPNPNGWNLKQGDAFASDLLESASSSSRIILANPPFEKVEADMRKQYGKVFREPQFVNKAAEIHHRCLAALPVGGVFGFVAPQNLLHSKDATAFRKLLCDEAEFEEICLFPDKVFNFADVETAILVGRKVALRADRPRLLQYRRVREGEMPLFRQTYGVTSEVPIAHSRFAESETNDLRVPDLEEIWNYTSTLPKLDDFVEIGQGFSFVGEDQPNYPKGEVRTSAKPREGFEEGFENLGANVMSHQLPPTAFLNMTDTIIRRQQAGTKIGIPQVLVNEAPLQRAPWCVKAMIDNVGRPATTRFTIMRPRKDSLNRVSIWALINSPFFSAFAYTHSTKRDILTGTWRKAPLPEPLCSESLEPAVQTYFDAVDHFENTFTLESEDDHAASLEALKVLHWRIDAEVLKLYNLPVELERKLLDYFAGCKRVGVPFHQDRYFPEGFDVAISLADYLAITADWEETNSRRLALIERKLDGTLTKAEQPELKDLKRLARAKSALVMPLPTQELAQQEADLRRKGLWQGE